MAAFETTPGGGICHLLVYLWGKWNGIILGENIGESLQQGKEVRTPFE